ncbi:MAG: glycosyltransferase family 2 protein, partial [Deltaproteobacteria bacterium]|nr:glycosyltransferase family 2 protein [Deltaproteobacteria bacterium]
MGDRLTISIVVPCYNEEESLPQLSGVLQQLIAAYEKTDDVEILLVDDGSTDGTLAALERLAPGLRGHVLKHVGNKGIAEAYRTGFQAAKGDIVCTIDADCTFDPLELVPMLAELRATAADLVVASPYHPRGRVEGVPGWRLILSRGASWIYRLLLPVKLYSYT